MVGTCVLAELHHASHPTTRRIVIYVHCVYCECCMIIYICTLRVERRMQCTSTHSPVFKRVCDSTVRETVTRADILHTACGPCRELTPSAALHLRSDRGARRRLLAELCPEGLAQLSANGRGTLACCRYREDANSPITHMHTVVLPCTLAIGAQFRCMPLKEPSPTRVSAWLRHTWL